MKQANNSPIVIVSYSYQFPLDENCKSFWELLINAKHAFTSGNTKQDPLNCVAWLKNNHKFDFKFFNITDAEASNIDPQQKMLLELVWHCYENSGMELNDLQIANTGVYVGAIAVDYIHYLQKNTNNTKKYAWLGTCEAILANRISHFMKFNGPSMTINTACSSALVALHLAKQALLEGEIDFAFVTAANLIRDSFRYGSYKDLGLLSSNTAARGFDAYANGFIPGEGGGAILLTRLSTAISNNLQIYGIIKGSAVNQTNTDSKLISTPSVNSQVKVIKLAMEDAKLTPEQITYIEAHGTGTLVGDPVEINAIINAYNYQQKTCRAQPLYIGSVKSSIGHLENAAGIAGIIKALLILKNRIIPASIGVKTVNPLIANNHDLIKFIYNNTSLDNANINIAISAFGFGGSNAHTIIGELEDNNAKLQVVNSTSDLSAYYPVVFSSLDNSNLLKLQQLMQQYSTEISNFSAILPNISRTLISSRQAFGYRIAGMVSNKTQFLNLLNTSGVKTTSKLKPLVLLLNEWSKSTLIVLEQLFAIGFMPDIIAGDCTENIISLENLQHVCSEPQNIKLYLNNNPQVKLINSDNKKITRCLQLSIDWLSALVTANHNLDSDVLNLIKLSIPLYQQNRFFHDIIMQWQKKADELGVELPNLDNHVTAINKYSDIIIALAIIDAFNSLGQKWNFVENIIAIDVIKQALTLKSIKILTIEDLVKLIINPSNLVLREILQNINYKLLHHFGDNKILKQLYHLRALQHQTIFFNNVLEKQLLATPYNIVKIGQVSNIAFGNFDIIAELTDMPEPIMLDNFILAIWQQGYDLKLSQHFSALKKHSPLILPNYQFNGIAKTEEPTVIMANKQHILEHCFKYVKTVLGEVLGILPDNINNTTEFEELGISSANIVQITEQFSRKFGEQPVTLLYEYQTINELTHYFAENFCSKNLLVDETVKLSLANKLEDIAIIGMSLKFPGANSTDEYWELLQHGKSAIREVPLDRWDHDKYFTTENVPGKSYTKYAGFIDDVKRFDALFFNIAPKDAKQIDPQERVFLEIVWHALEDAGYSPSYLQQNKVGVFASVTNGMYGWMDPEAWKTDLQTSVSSAYWSLANRVSYFCNFTGPSLVIDTACSSSLTAIHLACQSLKLQECDIAIAGGSSLILHPRQLVELANLNMLSKTAQLKAFSQNADGFVYGEGVAAIILKPLSQALIDNDQIYAVIKGSAINATGKTSGYSVPNPSAQANVVQAALAAAKLDPKNITYIEAHGTGTNLGDPIEIRGLTKVFDNCGPIKIGSLKPNIGHTEASAGIASLIKLALQLKYKKLCPTINTQPLNQKISFATTPFIVNETLVDWELPEAITKRYAGVSAFGVGGANAHLILEEAPIDTVTNMRASRAYIEPYLIPLSAKSSSALLQSLKNLHNFLQKNPNIAIADLAYTLCLRKEHFNKRFITVATSVADLVQQLQVLLTQNLAISRILETTQTTKYKDVLISYMNQEGVDFRQYFTNQYQTIRLPHYPFEGDNYWTPPDLIIKNTGQDMNIKVKSLIDGSYTTNLNQHYCWKDLNVNEFYLGEHILDGKQILPGVMHLELARSAITFLNKIGENFIIKNCTWVQPIVVNSQITKIYIVVDTTENFITYKITDETKSILFSQGTMEKAINHVSLKKLAVQDLIEQFPVQIFKAEVYQKFHDIGWQHGHNLQTIDTILLSNANPNRCVVKICLPNTYEANEFARQYPDSLHPSILDGIVQSVIGIKISQLKFGDKPALPFGFEKLQVLANIPHQCWVHINKKPSKKEIECFDLDVYDLHGNLILNITNFKAKAMQNNNIESTNYLDFYYPVWQTAEQFTIGSKEIAIIGMLDQNMVLEYQQHFKAINFVIYAENGFRHIADNIYALNPNSLESWQKYYQQIKNVNQMPDSFLDLSALNYHEDSINSDKIHDFYLQTYTAIQTAVRNKLKTINWIKCFNDDPAGKLHASVIKGFAQTLQREYSGFILHTVFLAGFDRKTELNNLKSYLHNESNNVAWLTHKMTNGNMETIKYKKIIPANSSSLIRQHGVYLVIGGLGGIGLLLAEYLAKKYQAKVVLLGRSSITIMQQQTLYNLRDNGGIVSYVAGDVAHPSDVTRVLQYIMQRHGTLHGVFHSAGVLKDSLIFTKSLSQIKDVFTPKVAGIMYLAEQLLSQEYNANLDFILLFSSISAIFGNVGQSDYGSANAFLDSYAEFFADKLRKVRNTILVKSINWPYLAHGGMQVSKEIEKVMEEKWGMYALNGDDTIKAIEAILQTPADVTQIMVVHEKGSFFKDKLQPIMDINILSNPIMTDKDSETPQNEQHSEGFNEFLQQLTHIVATIIEIAPDQLDFSCNLSSYGFNSISFTELSNTLNKTFKLNITPALFFEYTTLQDIAAYCIKQMPDLKKKLDFTAARPNVTSQINLETKNTRAEFIANEQSIAIIGMAGKFPGAKDLDEFWQNMLNATNVIREIPDERWDWRAIYGDPSDGNKTNIRWGAFINDYYGFDADFFGIIPRQAMFMDPQHRLFLETAWSCLEEAGYAQEYLAGKKVGIFMGVSTNDYITMLSQCKEIDGYTAPGSVHCLLPNQGSYHFNFTGPSESIDTACSSSLVTVHRAMQAILSGECEYALAGGVNALLHPIFYISFSKAAMLSQDGKCKTFDKNADGYVRGEGIGVVLLKKLTSAISDGDQIHGIICGSGVNHGGKANTLTSPNPKAQTNLILDVFKRSNVPATSISYIETHGTGTALGDPIEVNALKTAFNELLSNDNEAKTQFCGLGSVKTHIGHLEPAAGIASVIKILLAFRHKVLPGNLNFEQLNPYIDLDASPFYLVNNNTTWSRTDDQPRRAAISSFGFGGVNAHIILEESVKQQNLQIIIPIALITLSAATRSALIKNFVNLRIWLEANVNTNLTQLSYTLNTGRNAMRYRVAFIVNSIEDLIMQLQALINSDPNTFVEVTKHLGIYIPKLQLMSHDNLHEYQTELQNIAKQFLSGYKISWRDFYQGHIILKLSLPTYPFEHVTFKLPNAALNIQTEKLPEEKLINLTKYAAIIEAHEVLNHQVLPGVIWLKLIDEIINEYSLGMHPTVIELKLLTKYVKNLENPTIKVLLSEEDSTYLFEFLSSNKEQQYAFARISKNVINNLVNPEIDIKQFISAATATLEQVQIYQHLNNYGLKYGKLLQNLQIAYKKSDAILAVVGEIIQDDLFKIKILDASLQCLGLLEQQNLLPQQLTHVAQYLDLSQVKYIYAKRTGDTTNYQLWLLSISCQTILYMKNVSLSSSLPKNSLFAAEHTEVFLPHWKQIKLLELGQGNKKDTVIINFGDSSKFIENFAHYISAQKTFVIDDSIVTDIDKIMTQMTHLPKITNIYVFSNQSLNVLDFKNTILFKKLLTILVSNFSIFADNLQLHIITINGQSVIPNETVCLDAASWHGLALTLQQEMPNWQISYVDLALQDIIDPNLTEGMYKLIANKIQAQTTFGQIVAIRRMRSFVKVLKSVTLVVNQANIFKTHGTYIIIGGTGGLGLALAEYLARKYMLNIVLIGRKLLGNTLSVKVQELNGFKAKVEYLPCDVTDIISLTSTYQLIKQKYNNISGIFQLSMVLQDKTLLTMNEDDFLTAFNSKAVATLNIMQVFKDTALDFMLCFSSIQSYIARAGQANYIAGCAVQDALPYANQGLFPIKVINWGYWGSIGAVSSDLYRQKFFAEGLLSIDPEFGFSILEKFLVSNIKQIAIVAAGPEYFKKFFRLYESKKNIDLEMREVV